MTKPVTRKMAVDCLLYRVSLQFGDYLKCAVCKSRLLPGDDIQFDHHHAIVFEGPHEYQNLRPIHAECHKGKTRADVQANAKIKRLLNPKPSKHPMKSGKKKIPSRPFRSKQKPPSRFRP